MCRFYGYVTAEICTVTLIFTFSVIVGVERQAKLLDGSSKFVLTYEDKEGDWMLVGDVPWGYVFRSLS